MRDLINRKGTGGHTGCKIEFVIHQDKTKTFYFISSTYKRNGNISKVIHLKVHNIFDNLIHKKIKLMIVY